jgi:hypothetical protein
MNANKKEGCQKKRRKKNRGWGKEGRIEKNARKMIAD